MRLHLGPLGIGLLAILATQSVCCSEEKPSSSKFLAEATSRFKEWDRDQNGELSANEVELAITNPKVKGSSAATAVAIRRGMRSNKLESVTLDSLQKSVTAKNGTEPKPPAYEKLYSAALEQIEKTPKELFPTGSPKLDQLSQGHLGDCYLLAGLGTLVHRQPDRLKKFFVPKDNGKIEVRFEGVKHFEIDLPTDGEIALGSKTGGTGIWSNTYEKAIGSIELTNNLKSKREFVAPFQCINVGGAPKDPIGMATGKVFERFYCEVFRDPKIETEQQAAKLNELSTKLKEAFEKGTLVVCGNGPKAKQAIVPGIVYNHSYGVLGYDAKKQLVTLWNPISPNFTPKGNPGLEHGYKTERGQFQVPLQELVKWLGAFSFETEKKFTIE